MSQVKHRISHNFDKAAHVYTSRARVQAKVSEYLCDVYLGGKTGEYPLAVDLGCGPAPRIDRLNRCAQQIIGIDISMNMLLEASSSSGPIKSEFLRADVEQLPLLNQSVDLFYSSMALQWCTEPVAVFNQLDRCLKVNGRGILAILVKGSFSSLTKAWDALGKPARVNSFRKYSDWINAASRFDWDLQSEIKTFSTEHNDLIDMLNSIKGVGANTKLENEKMETSKVIPNQTFLARSELRAVSEYLKRESKSSDSLYLDYKVLFLNIKKRR